MSKETTLFEFTVPIVLLVAVVVLFLSVIVIVPAYFEAKTYNKLTGANATTWDALWVELRVQNSTK